MIPLAIVRHAPTDWNAAGRIQGRSDPGLGTAGRGVLAAWRMPGTVREFRLLSSPLRRAVETAEALFGRVPALDDRLVEMAWGDWEGRSLAELRAALGEEMAAREALGLDFRPPGGESPRDVQARVRPLLTAVAASGEPHAFVTHKGVLRAVYAAATGWDMKAKPADRLRNDCYHLFAVGDGGTIRIERLNQPLEAP